MGAGASVNLQDELSKPIDGSDLGDDPGAAKAEVLRLRSLLSASGGSGTGAGKEGLEWRLGFGAYKNISFEDEDAASRARDALVLQACDKLIEGKAARTGRVTVLGANTPTSAGYPPQQVDPCALRVVEHFSSQAEYEAADKANEGSEFPAPTVICKGPMWYVKKPDTASGEVYAIVGTQSAASKDSVEALIDAHKRVALEQLAYEEGALGYAILPPTETGGVVLRNIAWFASADAHEIHKARRDASRMEVVPLLMKNIDFEATEVTESGMREFAAAAHLESEGLRKGKGKGIRAIIGFGEEE